MDKTERRKRIFIFLTFLASLLAVSLLGAALGTDYWIVSRLKDINTESPLQLDGRTTNDNETIRAARQILSKNRPGGFINFGLFHGFVRHNKGLGDREAELKTICQSASCFHLFVVDPAQNHVHINPFSNFTVDLSYADLPYTDLCASESKDPSQIFEYVHLFSFGLWATTIFFLCLALLFGVIGSIYALLNTTYTPIAVFNGVAGLYLWSGLGVATSLLSMFMWVILFYTHFQYNVLPAELLYPVPKFTTCGIAELGFSFWLCLVSMLLFAFNIVLLTVKDMDLRRRSVKRINPSNDNMFMY